MREQLTDEALVLMASGSKPGSVGLDYDEALTSLARELLARRRAENPRLREALTQALAANERWQKNSAETWEAMQTMRDAINEHIPMPSLESDLLQGPENSVFCAAVAEAVVNTLAALRIENERLRGALEGMDLEAQRASVEALLKPTLIHLVMKMSDDARAALGMS